MNRILLIFTSLLVLIIALELFYLFQFKKDIAFPFIGKVNTPYKSSEQRSQLSPTPTVYSKNQEFKIIYQAPGDREGRTVLYQGANLKYSGSGEFYGVSYNPFLLKRIIGIFEGWEEIPDSKDKYIILKDPINNKILQKARVAFEKSNLFDKGLNATSLAVEYVDKKDVVNLHKRVYQLPEDSINNLIKKGDAIVLIPLFEYSLDGKMKSIKKDQNNIILVSWLIIRRNSENEIEL